MMPTKEHIANIAQYGLPDCPAVPGRQENPLEINVGDDIFIINHVYTGTHTIQEIYEGFLRKAITNC